MAKSFQEQIDAIMNKQFSSGKGVPLSGASKRILKREAEILRSYIQRQILTYYDAYKPVLYKRTYLFRNSIENPRITSDGAVISFSPTMTNHPALFSNSSSDVASLINYGWAWKNYKNRVYHFTYYPGFHFLEKAVAQYLATGHKAMIIEIHDAMGHVNTYDYQHLPKET